MTGDPPRIFVSVGVDAQHGGYVEIDLDDDTKIFVWVDVAPTVSVHRDGGRYGLELHGDIEAFTERYR